MKQLALATALVLGLGVPGLQSSANAQPRPGYGPGVSRVNRPPTQSPYLNLLRGGSPAANYYMGVRPERERRVTAAEVTQLEQDFYARPLAPPAEAEERLLPTTGHPTYFMNYSYYYGQGTLGSGGPGAARTPRGRTR
jgi:hypothetical protein